MPVLGEKHKLEIKLLEGIELVSIECIRNMIKIVDLSNDATTFESKWKVFAVKYQPDAQTIPVYDDTGYMTKAHSVYTLSRIKDKSWISKWLETVPEDVKNKLKKIVKEHGIDEDDLAESLSKILMTPIPRLENPNDIAKMSEEKYKEQWETFIESIISPGAEKDHRMKLVYKIHLLRGFIQKYNPHTLSITNSDAGRTTYYSKIGKTVDKASSPRLIGYSDAQKPYPGTVDNLYVVLCIEQIESQTAPDILAFMLSFMESGEARSETGAEGFTVKGTCPFVITANPTGYEIDKITTFRALIDHLTGNLLALGKRFGIIIYGKDYGTVVIKKPVSDVEWKDNVQKFRSIEEYVLPLINGIFKDKAVFNWLEKPLSDYEERGKELIEGIKDEGVKDFLITHFELGYRHLKGAALNSAIIDVIPRLVKVKVTGKEDNFLIIELLGKAEGYLKEIIAINLESVANMASAEGDIADIIFEQLPKYIQELTYAAGEYRKKGLRSREILVNNLDSYSLKQHFQYMSQVVNALDNISAGKISDNNRILEKYWWFRIVRKEQHIYSIEFVR